MIVFFNGQFVDDSKVCIPITDSAFLMGFGVYETLCTYKGTPLFLDPHITRLFEGAEKVGIEMPFSRDEMADAIEDIVRRRKKEVGDENEEFRIRVTVSGGEYDVYSGKGNDPLVLITAQSFVPRDIPPVRVVIYEIHRNFPEVKSTSMMASIMSKKYAKENDAYESIMVNQGKVLEGTFANVFFVQDGKLYSPDSGMLNGITHMYVLDIAHEIGPKPGVQELSVDELRNADEVFLTSSARGVIPVSHVDGEIVGNGEIGPYTQRVKEEYRKRMDEYVANLG